MLYWDGESLIISKFLEIYCASATIVRDVPSIYVGFFKYEIEFSLKSVTTSVSLIGLKLLHFVGDLLGDLLGD
jgi:hypothetical protein